MNKYSKYQVEFITPNGIRWKVKRDSIHEKNLSLAVKLNSKEPINGPTKRRPEHAIIGEIDNTPKVA